jgi:hypothetical protein
VLRTSLDQAYLKRSIRPLYTWTQATPKGMYLDPAFDRSVDIYPGMVAVRAGGDLVTLPNAAGDLPQGLWGNFIGGYDIDELRDSGVNACAVWVLGPDAEVEVDAPAFDDAETWTDPTDGTETLVHFWVSGARRGQLAPAGASTFTLSTYPVARLLKINSDATITLGGLQVRTVP